MRVYTFLIRPALVKLVDNVESVARASVVRSAGHYTVHEGLLKYIHTPFEF